MSGRERERLVCSCGVNLDLYALHCRLRRGNVEARREIFYYNFFDNFKNNFLPSQLHRQVARDFDHLLISLPAP